MATQTRLRIRQSAGDSIFKAIIFIVLLFCTVITLLPVINVIFVSFTSTSEQVQFADSFLHFPRVWVIDNYRYLLGGSQLWRAMLISITRTILGTVLALILSTLTAYPLSRLELPGKNLIMFVFFFTMVFSAGTIPTYLAVRNYGLIDTFWAFLLPMAMSTYNMIIIRTYFHSLPHELEEAATIDGCSDIGVMIRIIIPLSTPVFASVGLFYAVQYWNSWFDSILYIRSRSLWPLQLYLREIINTASVADIGLDSDASLVKPTANALTCAMIVFTAMPIIIVYPFVQKYFVKGIMIGAVKG